MMLRSLAALLLSVAIPASAQNPPPAADLLSAKIDAILADPDVAQAHVGVRVVRLDGTARGTEIYTHNDAQLFIPASNTKMLTTAALSALFDASKLRWKTQLLTAGAINATGTLKGDLVLLGAGDPSFGGHTYPFGAKAVVPPDPEAPLRAMVEQLTAAGVKSIDGDIVGDDSFFAEDPYGVGRSWDDLQWPFGAPVSALTLNDNAVALSIAPTGEASWSPAGEYYRVNGTMQPVPQGAKAEPGVDRPLNSLDVRVWGTMAASGFHTQLAVSEPAKFVAIVLRRLLLEHGITVSGLARAVHRGNQSTAEFVAESHEPLALTPITGEYMVAAPTGGRRVLAESLSSATAAEDIVLTNKMSNNLHADLYLKLLGRVYGRDGSFAQGDRVLHSFLTQAGVSDDDMVLFDGSGESHNDLVTPRAFTALLVYAARQPWGQAWWDSLPIGGVDGTLAHRFTGALKGKVFAKTGTHDEANALSGYVTAKSGNTLAFSIMIDSHRPESNAARQAIDRIVEAVAEAN